jgi:lipopolysaccharide/colanic/teichoic acid biosynthesis glycosyltransferase
MLQEYKRSAVILADALGWLNWASDEAVESAIGGVRFSTPRAIKRGIDIAFSALSLILLLPLMLLLAMEIKLTSHGPVLHRSMRLGAGGRPFALLKFKIPTLPWELTLSGRFWNATSLNELPKLLNVLRGDMSLVGPHPFPAADLDPSAINPRFLTWLRERSRMKPGITGLWQVASGNRNIDDLVKYDLEYVKNWSVFMDIQIMLKTPVLTLPTVDEEAMAAINNLRFREA